ncbi:uncharacterized protein LAJ45_09807 [Morchella importuna]|uniref:uncharacterized protein n=1 Tax=Morchella importuna TaxID=1174673 RepID=UPI001E8E86CF|nr:uncharacterized protein LAJ45_09807 [Morchella importuna]KAH8146117.1 hypothetical protein LAJ45_09807 [Morchella importuna]
MAEAFGIVGSSIAVLQLTTKLISLGYEYISGLKDAPREIRQLVNELYSLSQILFSLRDSVRDRADIQQEILKMLDGQNGLLSECLMELKRIQLKIEPKIDQGSGSRMAVKTRLLMTEKDIIKHISQLERYKISLGLVLDRVQLSLIGAIDHSVRDTNRIVHNLQAESSAHIVLSESILGSIHTKAIESQAARNQDEERERAKRRNDILEWLSKTLGDFDNKHPEISRERRANTGKWLLREPAFQSFIKGDPNFLLLWGYGIPGAGKTFLR